MVQVKKKEGETVEAMLRRFKKKLLQSGVLQAARDNRFRERDISKNQKRKEAQARENIRQKREYLRKIGKLDSKKKGGR
ncbi:30S ribosomal protein S21 [Patescibacteria group bacterium]|nr:30S ribosomal protein S21 [Patescibacteria group bacterium]